MRLAKGWTRRKIVEAFKGGWSRERLQRLYDGEIMPGDFRLAALARIDAILRRALKRP